MRKKVYLGDGVYAEYDGQDLILTTENGVSVTNRIVLDPHVWRSLRDVMDVMDEIER